MREGGTGGGGLRLRGGAMSLEEMVTAVVRGH